MKPFTALTGIAAPLPMANVDTDMIIPKQFLKTITREGLGKALFHEMRTRPDGTRVDDFVLHRAPYDKAEILVAGENFGCGSSREHAPWALQDFGIRCIIAPSYADIFYNNCFKNGMLPVRLPPAQVEACMAWAKTGQKITVDLTANHVRGQDGTTFSFSVDDFRRDCLLKGLDDIGLTEQNSTAITAFENQQKENQPWLWNRVS